MGIWSWGLGLGILVLGFWCCVFGLGLGLGLVLGLVIVLGLGLGLGAWAWGVVSSFSSVWFGGSFVWGASLMPIDFFFSLSYLAFLFCCLFFLFFDCSFCSFL